MTQNPSESLSDADRPLQGEAPVPDQLRQHDPHPNDAVHTDIKPGWKNRPADYPATRNGLDTTDSPEETPGSQGNRD